MFDDQNQFRMGHGRTWGMTSELECEALISTFLDQIWLMERYLIGTIAK